MPTISSPGIGSGLDIRGLVDQLVAAEGDPVRVRLDRTEARLQASLSALGTFRGAVSDFQTALGGLVSADSFSSIEVTSANEDRLVASGNKNAVPGAYEVGIVQLAQAQKLAGSAQTSDLDAIGTGGITISLGRYDTVNNTFVTNSDISPVSLNITTENNSLRGIADAINKATDSVRASVINDGSGYRLVVSSQVEGTDGAIRISVLDDDGNNTDTAGLSQFAYDELATTNMSQTVAAQDATINVDGLTITRSSNEIDDVIQGVVLELQPGSEGTTTRLDVALDTGVAVDAIKGFIDKYNALIGVASDLTGYDPETRTAGPLSGDASVRGIISQVRRIMSQSFNGINSTYDSLASIGVETNRDGTLKVDDSELQAAIDDNLQEVMQLFATTGSTSDALVNYQGATDNTRPGTYSLEISQIATQGSFTGTAVTDGAFTLAAGDNTLQLTIDGTLSSTLTLREGSYTGLDALAVEIQNAINSDSTLSANGISATVSYSGGQMQIVSNRYGTASSVSVTAIDAGVSTVSGLTVGAGTDGVNVQGSFNGISATGDGRTLTGEGIAKGLEVEVLGGALGDRGKVVHATGLASLLSDLLDNYEGSDGLFDSRNKGFNERLEDINQQREQLARKMEAIEARYLKQFSALDTLIGSMRSTSDFLSQQLAGLPWSNFGKK